MIKKLLSSFAALSLTAASFLITAAAFGDTPIKNLTLTGSTSQIASGVLAVKTGVVVTFESGSTLDATAATVKVGTVTGATNTNVIVDANGTGKFQINDTVTTATNTDLIVDANGTGKFIVSDTISTPTNTDLVEDANGTGKFIVSDTISTPTNTDLVVAPNGTGKLDLRAAPLKAGTATAGTAPLKFSSGTNLTAAEAGAEEFDGSWRYYTTTTPTRFRYSRESAATAIASTVIDWSAATVFTKTLAANTTFTFSNATDGQTIVVALTNTASNYTVTWPTISWTGGVAPTQTVGAKTDVYTIIKIGSVYYGSVVQNF
jgi:hypothetical protein